MTINQPKNLQILSILFLLALLPACYPQKPKQEIPALAMVSLKEHLPALEKVAKAWRPDAVLTWVHIDIDDPTDDLLSAAFGTDSTTDTLYLSVGHDGEIESKILKNPEDHENLPIAIDKLKIDSPEALEILLDEDGKRYLATSEYRRCSFLILDRERTLPGYPILWRVTLWDCSSRENNYFYIDAITGEKVIVDKTVR